MENDFDDSDYSIEREFKREENRAREFGFAGTKQSAAIYRRFGDPLADAIAADRIRGRRSQVVWRFLKRRKDDALADRLLIAGVNVCWGHKLGVDESGEKKYLEILLFIARQFRQDLETELAVKVGEWGVQMLLTLPIFKFEGGLLTLPMTDDLIDFLAEVIMRGAAEHPYLFPSGTPPRPWTGVRAGCLPPDDWARPPLIRSRYPVIEDVARKRIGTGQMQPMLDAVHALQSTAFMINEPVLHFMWGDDSPDRPRPDPNTSEKEQREAATKLQEWEMARLTALLLAALKRFFIYLNIDFRGRLNPLPHFHYMRDDLVRGLFLFADEARIGEEGLQYLKAHVARAADGNKWSGVEKPSKLNFEQRIAWTENNLETLRNIGDAVLRGDDRATWAWALPKKPCQFVAACVELKQALDTVPPPDFKTRLPLNFDGSCSGLQHLCAMMRAEEGRYANLTANVVADDFYLRVAGQVYDKYPGLRYLMEGRDDRDIVKRPCMTYFYASLPGGFTFTDDGGHLAIFGMMAQVVEVLEDRQMLPKGTLKRARERQKLRKGQKLEKRQKLNAEDWQALMKILKDARRLAQAIYDTIEAMVPAAKAVREFLQKIVKLYAKEKKPLRWTTPHGLCVINIYQKSLTRNIPTWPFPKPDNRRRCVTVAFDSEPGIRPKKAANAVAANFTHSQDAAHLHSVALAAVAENIPMAAIHDCFMCLAPHAERFNVIIREQLIRLYEQYAWLEAIWEAANEDLSPANRKRLPPLPEKGTLDLEEVKQSFFAFA